MSKFTVVLLRPDYMSYNYGQDIYVAHVEAECCNTAHVAACKDVFKADKRDGLEPYSVYDYALCVMFSGHIQPCLFGWQL